MRRGSFFASELKPVSILFFSIVVLGFHGQTTVFLHAPEVNSDEQERNERENHHVKHVKTQQCVFPDDVTAQHQETNFPSTTGMAKIMLVPTVTAQNAS